MAILPLATLGFLGLLFPVAAHARAATLVRQIATYAFSPPSPDPAGIACLACFDRLLVADAEVPEMSIWQGANLLRITRSGSVVGRGGALAYSIEVTGDDSRTPSETDSFGSTDRGGITYNTAQGLPHLVDGNDSRVYTLHSGPNGVFDGVPGVAETTSSFTAHRARAGCAPSTSTRPIQ